MAFSPAKENILKKIREALSNPVPLPFPQSEGQPVFVAASGDLTVIFAEEFTRLQGKFAYCQDETGRRSGLKNKKLLHCSIGMLKLLII